MPGSIRRAALVAGRLALPGGSLINAAAATGKLLRSARVYHRLLTSGTAYSAVVVGVPRETFAGEQVCKLLSAVSYGPQCCARISTDVFSPPSACGLDASQRGQPEEGGRGHNPGGGKCGRGSQLP